MAALFTKTGCARAIAFEVAGLTELQAAADDGGAPVAQLANWGTTQLQTTVITTGLPSAAAAREFGARLAVTHAWCPAQHRVFGQAPAGFGADWDYTGVMGQADLPLVPPGSAPRSFGEFYATDRLLPYLPAARDNGSLTAADAAVITQLAQRLRDGIFDAPQPALIATDAALLHGDLWAGNLLWARGGTPTLIDPACQGGHAESDLAQLQVFHSPHTAEIYAGYQEVSPLADGWEERIGLHQLHILLVHAALFGGSYGHQTVAVARRYL
ncbi:MAG: fructosamine kinase family protein [Trueperella sp.]|nr:fructosamine kinase family protein [Trueperella sp.]